MCVCVCVYINHVRAGWGFRGHLPYFPKENLKPTYCHCPFNIPETLEKAMAPHSSTLAWKIPWTEEPGRLQSMGSLGVRHN